MNNKLNGGNIFSALLGIIVFVIGGSNLILVHPVPGIVFLFISFLYFPPINVWLNKRFGFSIPPVVKMIIGLLVIWFTLGVSDLGDMIDDLWEG